jgi:hypothetical protein
MGPLPANTALGLSAFYVSLLAMMVGVLGATIVNSSLDGALGYATTELGAKWRQRRPLPISRRETLVLKRSVALVVVPLLHAAIVGVAAGMLGLVYLSLGSSGGTVPTQARTNGWERHTDRPRVTAVSGRGGCDTAAEQAVAESADRPGLLTWGDDWGIRYGHVAGLSQGSTATRREPRSRGSESSWWRTTPR